jgi:hypothetical protein
MGDLGAIRICEVNIFIGHFCDLVSIYVCKAIIQICCPGGAPVGH